MKCIFCDIVNGHAPATIIYESDKIIAFDDINPVAPQHKLIIPKKHFATLNDVTLEDKDLLSDMLFVAKKLAIDLDIDKSGYRTIFNCNKDGGQLVYHLHLHLIGGRALNTKK